MIKVILAVLTCLAITWVSITQKPEAHQEKPRGTLKEVVWLQGTCSENHVKQTDVYSGNVVRWLDPATGKLSTYGFVSLSDLASLTMGEISHPTVYHMPYLISFYDIDLDTNRPRWLLHGVSQRSENEQGYDSTCDLTVVKRGTELPNSGSLTGDKP